MLENIFDLLKNSCTDQGSKPILHYFDTERQKHCTLRHPELAKDFQQTAITLIKSGIEHNDRVIIMGPTSYFWILADCALQSIGAISVPIYPSSSRAEIESIISDAEPKAAFVADDATLKMLLTLPATKNIRTWFILSNVKSLLCLSFNEILSPTPLRQCSYDEIAERARNVSRETLATIVYTSGTTGKSKGVMLTHGNLLYQAGLLERAGILSALDRELLILPLSHIFARQLVLSWFFTGHQMFLSRGPQFIFEELENSNVTFLASVPRFFEKLHISSFEDSASSAINLRAVLGGSMRCMLSGGAPLASEIIEFFAHALIPIHEGYGLTEASAGVSLNFPEKIRFGSVGHAHPGTRLKIAPDGEILIKGPGIFKGYWQNAEATDAALKDGWLHSGDLGFIDEDGFIFINGRKKDLIVNANGKNIAPMPIEVKLQNACPFVHNAVVLGDRRPFLVALFTLHEEFYDQDIDYRAHLQKAIDYFNSTEPSYRQIKRFLVLARPFIVGEELTITQKVRRKKIEEIYADVIEHLYA